MSAPLEWKAACRERCADFGDPPCFEVVKDCGPCDACLDECGVEVPEPLDPEAAMRLLI